MLDGTETTVVNGPLISDGEVAVAATEEDVAVCPSSSFDPFQKALPISFTEDLKHSLNKLSNALAVPVQV